AEWWGRVERSTWSTSYFLLQTFPSRLVDLARNISSVPGARDIQLSFSNLNRRIFGRLMTPPIQVFSSLFPTLFRHPRFIYSPLAFIRDEFRHHRRQLEATRDSRARELGNLTFIGAQILALLKEPTNASQDNDALIIKWTAKALNIISAAEAIQVLRELLCVQLPKHTTSHVAVTDAHKRPSRWVLAWPRFILFPPAIFLCLRSLYSNRDSLVGNLIDIAQTVRMFWTQWIFEPIVDILNTVRTGGEEGVRVISKQGLQSDMESLERMVLDLAMETQTWSQSELHALSNRIRQGDLSTVLKIYEGDIKSPLRSAMSGTLVRSLLIQIQKAKVDIDFALAGIDKLLRSQELTFGFVGVAPSLAVVYIVSGWLRGLWSGGRGRGKYGGKRGRESSFYMIRRIERLLTNAQSIAAGTLSALAESSPTTSIPLTRWKVTPLDPLTQGLLLVSVSHLRRYVERHLPKRSRLREGFLEDLSDLEDPARGGRNEKLQVVHRMWHSWGNTLEWGKVET
ncbi:hypothetical protein BS47DRAFT_1297082, partial [Hydnum rufescens UP504]